MYREVGEYCLGRAGDRRHRACKMGNTLRNPQITADMYGTSSYWYDTNLSPFFSVCDTIGPEKFITNFQLKRHIPNAVICHFKGSKASPTSTLLHQLAG